jgi:hypothetical protein
LAEEAKEALEGNLPRIGGNRHVCPEAAPWFRREDHAHWCAIPGDRGGATPNTLSARLKVLETQGVIATRLYERHLPRYEYLLTAKGKSLGPVLKALGAWGSSYA